MAWTALLVWPSLALCSSPEVPAPTSQACAGGASDCGIGCCSNAALEPAFDEQPFVGESDGEVDYIDVSLLQHSATHVSPKSGENGGKPSTNTEELMPSMALLQGTKNGSSSAGQMAKNTQSRWEFQTIQVEGGWCLEGVPGAHEGSMLRLSHCNSGNQQQQWQYDRHSQVLKNSAGKCLTSLQYNWGWDPQVKSCDGGNWQRWQVSNVGGYSTILNTMSSFCLTAANQHYDGARVELKACNNGYDQRWNFVSGGHGGGETTASTTYRLIQVQDGICLTASDGGKDGGVVRLAWCDAAKNSQKWKYDNHGRALKNWFGKCVKNQGGWQGVEMRTCDGSYWQAWDFSEFGGFRPLRNAGDCLTASNSNQNLSPVYMKSCDSYRYDQRWSFIGNTGPTGFRGIRVDRGICLAASDAGLDGGVLRLAWCDAAKKTQKWKYDEGPRTLKNYFGKCVASMGYSGVEMRRCDGSDSQRWEFSNSGGYRPIRNSGICLTADDIIANGSPVYLSSCDTNREDQRWVFF